MANDLLGIAALLWIVAGLVALTGCMLVVSRALLALGGLAAIAAAIVHLPLGTGLTAVPLRMAGETAQFQMLPEAFWLMGFGLVPAVLACVLATPSDQGRGTWLFGAACSLLGALGVFGLQHGGFFLLAWELMSLGGAIMILGERLAPAAGQPVLFMLGMLEVGAVALLVAFLLFAFAGDSLSFEAFARVGTLLPLNVQIIAGLLLIIGFGAKLGLLPFYEWFPSAYGSGSGASGAIMSGVVLNAAFFGLSRSLFTWLPGVPPNGAFGLGVFLVVVGVLERDPVGALCLPAGGLALSAELFVGGECWYRGDGVRCVADVPRQRASGSGWAGLDRGAAAPCRTCIGQGLPVPDRRWCLCSNGRLSDPPLADRAALILRVQRRGFIRSHEFGGDAAAGRLRQ